MDTGTNRRSSRYSRRRGLAVTSLALMTTLGLAACQTPATPAEPTPDPDETAVEPTLNPDEEVTIRFSWWGGDLRNERYLKIIDLFEAEYPNITVEPEFSDYGSFWDKLATQFAAEDAPDVMQFEDIYLRDYSDRGLLLDLSSSPEIDTSDILPAVLESGTTDAGLVGFPMGLSAPTLLASSTVLDAAGVERPDDTTWTWDDYAEIATKISASAPEGTFGSNAPLDPSVLNLWLRQHGASLYSEEGGIGFDEADLEGFYDFLLQLNADEAIAGGSVTTEDRAGAFEQTLIATNRVGLGWNFTNNSSALGNVAGKPFDLLRPPSSSGSASEAGQYYKVAFEAVNAQTEHPAAAATFVNFVVNSVEAGKVALVDRGVPVNATVREAILGELDEIDKPSVQFIGDIAEEVSASPIPPKGAAAVVAVLDRYGLQILFGELSPADAAKAAIAEIDAELG
jgi:multiple sugar transport system substrate-binding protein